MNLTTRAAMALENRTVSAVRQIHQHAYADLDVSGNGDDSAYLNAEASFTKLLVHAPNGTLTDAGLQAYTTLRRGIAGRSEAALRQVPLAPVANPVRVFINPMSGWSFERSGADVVQVGMAAPPSMGSRRGAVEMLETYAAALLRDVPFGEYATNGIAAEVAEVLTRFGQDYQGPRPGGVAEVSPDQLLRGTTEGDRTGPFLSQFLLMPLFPLFPSGCAGPIAEASGVPLLDLDRLGRHQHHPMPASPAEGGREFLTTLSDFTAVQNGDFPVKYQPGDYVDAEPRFLTRGRDLGGLVHVDAPYEAYTSAFGILLFRGAAFDPRLPYNDPSDNQSSGHTLGPTDVYSLIGEVSRLAFKAAWANKWIAHRRLRPEAMAARVHVALAGALGSESALTQRVEEGLPYGLHADLVLLGRPILDRVRAAAAEGGDLMLTQMYPEGSPSHPAYPSGHATVAGACTTIMKAFLREDAPIPALPASWSGVRGNVVPSADGKQLTAYEGTLLVGHELDKLASNIAHGRDFGGVHFRSDGDEGMLLGEQIALRLLQDHAVTYVESGFDGFYLTLRSGQSVRVDRDGVHEL